MNRVISNLSILSILVFLVGCSGSSNKSLEGKFEDGQIWTEQTYEMFFVCDDAYYAYENAGTSSVGQIRINDNDYLFFNMDYDSSGNLFFYPLVNEENQEYYFMGFFESADDNTYSVKVDYSRIPEIMPDGARLTFVMGDIDTANSYFPDYLGKLRDDR